MTVRTSRPELRDVSNIGLRSCQQSVEQVLPVDLVILLGRRCGIVDNTRWQEQAVHVISLPHDTDFLRTRISC